MKKYIYRVGGLESYVTAKNLDEANAKIKAINSFDHEILRVEDFTPIDGDFDDAGKIGKDSTSWQNRKR